MNKYKLYSGIVIIVLLSIVGFIINNYNKSICYNYSYDNTIMLEPDNDSIRPVKGMKYEDSIDSLVFTKHTDLSGIDGNNFYSRDLNPNNSNITPRVNNYATYNDEVEVKLPTKVTIKPSIIQVFSDRVSYDVTYNY